MNVKILYFAGARDRVGMESQMVSIPDMSSTSPAFMVSWILEQHPSLEPVMVNAMLAVNLEYVDKDDTNTEIVKDGAELAVIPPVSGG